MLLIARCTADLDFPQLMQVYAESNRENAADFYPFESPQRQIAMAEQAFYEYLQLEFFPQPNALYAIWQVSGQYVSALRLEPYRDGLLLEALETAPDCRSRGFAAALIEAVKPLTHEKLYSHISKRNSASLHVHEKCGFRKILDYAEYVDGTVSQNSCTMCLIRE